MNCIEILSGIIILIKIEIQENWYRAGNKLVGHKEFLVLDPDGYLLRFAQDIGEKEYTVE